LSDNKERKLKEIGSSGSNVTVLVAVEVKVVSGTETVCQAQIGQFVLAVIFRNCFIIRTQNNENSDRVYLLLQFRRRVPKFMARENGVPLNFSDYDSHTTVLF